MRSLTARQRNRLEPASRMSPICNAHNAWIGSSRCAIHGISLRRMALQQHNFKLPEDLVTKLDEYRFDRQFSSRTAAMVYLIQFALERWPSPKRSNFGPGKAVERRDSAGKNGRKREGG